MPQNWTEPHPLSDQSMGLGLDGLRWDFVPANPSSLDDQFVSELAITHSSLWLGDEWPCG
jgi:hypothetical protein